MELTLLRSYPAKDKVSGKIKLGTGGKPLKMFVYKVSGTKAELAKYAEIRKTEGHTHLDEDGVTYLYFTMFPCGVKGVLGISPNDKVFVDTTAMDLAQAMIDQHPGALGLALAKDILKEGFVSDSPAESELSEDDLSKS